MLSSFWSEFVLIFNTNPRLITLVWTACWAITSFALGVWAGHYLAKKRDKRKEFNLISDPMELTLRKNLRQYRTGNINVRNDPDFYALSIHFSGKKQEKYNAAIERYFAVWRQGRKIMDSGCFAYDISIPDVIDATECLLTFIKHR
ncbi:hypothetical protein ISO73_17640 [Morganella morganii subsp. morganii]|uniref:hypothetical protein n=1 Tax=Morganella morganii TaxID=582 RepID=UPI0005380D78|nr:hypothetical protein [Morganella morganii]AUT99885.1 hypothetical protein MC49_006745 [Morganella morganii]ELB3894385.1 hypothetical protein [Morganella morganii]MBT0350999.1 hypothetical protein [Morganella morganii subsp. morganii]MBT0452071.1 hypothetical protein [Morganella morganii subsp. morganii]OVF55226.1 hypothetical protein B5724_09835 [Morganella morganii]